MKTIWRLAEYKRFQKEFEVLVYFGLGMTELEVYGSVSRFQVRPMW
jgi:hypothetical protein